MNSKKWFKYFSLLSVVFLLIVAVLNAYVDPYRIYSQSWRMSYISDRNGRFSKLDRLKKSNGVELLVVGSSRSEFFFPKDLEKSLGLKSFTTAMGGAYTYTKYAFGMKGLELLPNLKKNVYVSDFYEFNKKEIPWLLADLEEFKGFFSSSDFDEVTPSKFRKISSLFSLTTLSASIKTIKDKTKNKPKSYLSDGSTTVSLTQTSFDDLQKEITKIEHYYLNDNWKGYEQLSSLSEMMIDKLVKQAQVKQVEVQVILTPLHPVLFKRFSLNKDLLKRWSEWKSYWQQRADNAEVTLYDFTDSEKYFANDSSYWQDGAHFSRKASLELIDRVRGE